MKTSDSDRFKININSDSNDTKPARCVHHSKKFSSDKNNFVLLLKNSSKIELENENITREWIHTTINNNEIEI